MKIMEFEAWFNKLAPHGVTTVDFGLPINEETKEPYPSPLGYYQETNSTPTQSHVKTLLGFINTHLDIQPHTQPAPKPTTRWLIDQPEKKMVVINLSPLFHMVRSYNQSVTALAGELVMTQSNLARYRNSQPIRMKTLTSIFLAAKSMIPQAPDEEFNNTLQACLNLEEWKIPQGPIRHSLTYDLAPIKNILLEERHSIASWARKAKITAGMLYKLASGPTLMTPSRFESLIEAAHELAPKSGAKLFAAEKLCGPLDD